MIKEENALYEVIVRYKIAKRSSWLDLNRNCLWEAGDVPSLVFLLLRDSK